MTGENLRLGLHDRRRHEGVQERGHRQLISRPPRVGVCSRIWSLIDSVTSKAKDQRKRAAALTLSYRDFRL